MYFQNKELFIFLVHYDKRIFPKNIFYEKSMELDQTKQFWKNVK